MTEKVLEFNFSIAVATLETIICGVLSIILLRFFVRAATWDIYFVFKSFLSTPGRVRTCSYPSPFSNHFKMLVSYMH